LLWFTPLLVPIVLGLTLGLRYLVREPDEQYIGTFQSEAEGERAAIRNLVEQMSRWPNAQTYVVARIQLNPQRTGIEAEWPVRTYYSRQKGLLYDEKNLFLSPWQWEQVTPRVIREVGAADGTFANFAERAVKSSKAVEIWRARQRKKDEEARRWD
jgi:hypothetical protein